MMTRRYRAVPGGFETTAREYPKSHEKKSALPSSHDSWWFGGLTSRAAFFPLPKNRLQPYCFSQKNYLPGSCSSVGEEWGRRASTVKYDIWYVLWLGMFISHSYFIFSVEFARCELTRFLDCKLCRAQGAVMRCGRDGGFCVVSKGDGGEDKDCVAEGVA